MKFIRAIATSLVVALTVQGLIWTSAPIRQADAAGSNGPRMVSTLPLDGYASVSPRATLKIAFDEPVKRGTGTIRLMSGSTTIESFDVATDLNRIRLEQPHILSIRPSAPMDGNRDYYVTISAGAILGASSNIAYPGFTSDTAWNFTVVNSAALAPMVWPPDTTTDIDADAAISLQLTFPGNIQRGSGYIQVKNASTDETVQYFDTASSSVRISGRTVTLQLAKLEYGTSYYVNIDPGAFLDAGGNPFEGIFDRTTWRFTTESGIDRTKPSATEFRPAQGGTIPSLNGTLSVRFDETVYASGGTIVIRGPSNALFCTIPVGSTAVSGSGSNLITLIPGNALCPPFVNGSSYTVQIPSASFHDVMGNTYDGTNSWSFTAVEDRLPPDLISTVPQPGANYVKIDIAELSAKFNEPITIVPSSIATLRSTGGPSVVADLEASSDASTVLLRPRTLLQSNLRYSVEIGEGTIQDLYGNRFPGILNEFRWSFQTLGSDSSPPTVASAAIDGAAVVLTFSEELDVSAVPYPANFYLTVNDVPRQIVNVRVQGSKVYLDLQSGIALGQSVQMSYSRDVNPARRIKDLSGNDAAGFSSRTVTNSAETTLPRVLSGVVSGNALTLTFNKNLAALSGSPTSQFTVRRDGNASGIAGASVNGSKLTLTLSGSVPSSQAVSVSYTPGSYPIRDTSGNAVEAFANLFVRNASDGAAPQMSSASVEGGGSKIVLTYNEGLDPRVVPPKSSYSVLSNGNAISIQSIAIVNNTVELAISPAITGTSTVFITYLPGTPMVSDLAGNPASPFSGHRIVVNAQAATAFSSAGLNTARTEVTLNFTGNLNGSQVPYTTQFLVRVGNGYAPIAHVAVTGSQVRLTLTTAIAASTNVTVNYSPSGIPLIDASNQPIAGFSDRPVGGTGGGGVDPVPTGFESDGNGGVLFPLTAASTTVSDVSAKGMSARRYIVDSTKLAEGFGIIGSTGYVYPRMTIRVPTSESAALVALPVQTLMEIATRISNASIKVEYGDLRFNLPLKAIDYASEVQKVGGSYTSAYILLNLERASDSAFQSLLSRSGAQIVGLPAEFAAYIATGGTKREVTSYNQYVTRTITTTGNYAPSQYAVVRLDAESGSISYVPTSIRIVGSTTEADFMRRGNSTYALVKRTAQFSDMGSHWARASVNLLASKFVVDAAEGTKFAPEKAITRADFARFIAQGLGLTGSRSAASRYSDVNTSNSAAAYIGAVSAAGIVQGGTDGKFRPAAPITREEMATIMVRAMNYAGLSATASSSALTPFSDRGKVSSWARNGMAICIEAGIITGVTSKTLKPQDPATRAQAAVILQRFLEHTGMLQR